MTLHDIRRHPAWKWRGIPKWLLCRDGVARPDPDYYPARLNDHHPAPPVPPAPTPPAPAPTPPPDTWD